MTSSAKACQTGSVALRCYDFTAANSTKRPVTDIHIPVGAGQKSDIPPSGPEGWGGRHDDKGITFETPPPLPPRRKGETRPRPMPPVPIPPGKRLRGFTFYLTGPAKTEGMFFTFPESDDTEEGSVEQGGTIIRPSESGTVTATGVIYCHEISITAPEDEQIDTVIFKTDGDLVHGSTVPQDGWITTADNDKDGGTLTAYSKGNQNPIGPGKTRVFRLYSKKKKLKVEWTALNEGWNLVDEGELTVKFKK